jgi:phenylalanyl-tRNA synthetase beta chain
MRVSFEWLKEYVEINISPAELAERMTMSGIAVEEIDDLAAPYRGMVVARVVALEQHPQAANLLITRVDAGDGIRQVITGAKNLRVGDLVPLALPGTVLPGGKQINEADFKGVLSQGMLCSGAELELEKESTGIWVFDRELAPGSPVAEALDSTDQVLVLELTANRPDCLGMIGVAREVAAILNLPFRVKPVQLKEEGPEIGGLAAVQIVDADLCPRYTARIATAIKIGPSPGWMRRRLKAAGVRPISNLVDITNYVMLEYNQPLHAYDLERIEECRIIVRRSRAGEKLVTLDEVERCFSPENLMIADSAGGLGIAGVMGGSSSEVTDETVSILLEAAYFNPISVRKTAKQLGMRTEASLRFERGIDPNNTVAALNRAAELIELLGAGKVARGYIDQYPRPVEPVAITTGYRRINQWLGTDLSGADIRNYLERVTFQVDETDGAGAIAVTVPTYRRDVTHMADLAEEVARLYGYDRIPVTLPPSRVVGERTPFQKFQLELRRLLQGIGLTEIITYSLNAKHTAAKLGIGPADRLSQTVDLIEPLSEDQAVMRTTLTGGMLETLAFNVKRRQNDLALYEISRVYWPVAGAVLPEEPLHLSIGLMGRRAETGWNQPAIEYDFYDLKGIVELICARFNLPVPALRRADQPFLHPGQSAEIWFNGKPAGFMGQVHPRVREAYDLTKDVFLIELDLNAIDPLRDATVVFQAPPRFPAVQRDLALVLPVSVTAEAVIRRIKEIGGNLVENVELFDVYQGEQVEAGMRSLAFNLSYRSKERTLSDAAVNQTQAELLQKLNAEYGAVIRG